MTPPGEALPRLAVFPFENHGASEDGYFADGMADEIRARLNRLQGLEVISRNSLVRYEGITPTTGQIRRELGAGYLLSGTIRWDHPTGRQSRVRVTPELTNLSSGVQVWSTTYEEDFGEVFRIQAEIAERVVHELDVTLLQANPGDAAARPTSNMDAYQAYLRGKKLQMSSVSQDDVLEAVDQFQHAVKLDPSFALAFAELAQTHARVYRNGIDRSQRRRELATSAIETAVGLDSNRPEIHRAEGFVYYWAHNDYDRALSEFAQAERDLPNDTEVLVGTGYILRRQGKFDEAFAKLERAFRLNPLDADLAMQLGVTAQLMRRFSVADSYCDQTLAINPGHAGALTYKAQILWYRDGSLDGARAILDRIGGQEQWDPVVEWTWLTQEILEGAWRSALDRLDAMPVDVIVLPDAYLPLSLARALVFHYMDDQVQADRWFERARIELEEAAGLQPEDPRIHSALGTAYAGLRRADDALREGALVTEHLTPLSQDAYEGTTYLLDLAAIHTLLGDSDAALDQLEALLSMPSVLSVQMLELDPAWKPLRAEPRFQSLIGRYR